MIPTRHQPLGAKLPPYDAELLYLQATYADTWIDSGVGQTSDIGVDITFMYRTGKTVHLLGEPDQGDNNTFLLGVFTRSLGARYAGGPDDIPGCMQGELHTVSFHGATLTMDNTISSTGESVPPDVPSRSLRVFGRPVSPSVRQIYSLKIYQGTRLVRDFIPVRVATTGYLYDRVSKGLFAGSGSRPLEPGPDKYVD